MKLKAYIDALTELLEEIGDPDADLYTSVDDEGNGYNKVFGAPGIYYLPEGEDRNRPECLIPLPEPEEVYRYWLDDHDLTESEVKHLEKVVLL